MCPNSKNCDYVIFADVFKLRVSTWGDYPGWSGWSVPSQGALEEGEEAEGSKSESEERTEVEVRERKGDLKT